MVWQGRESDGVAGPASSSTRTLCCSGRSTSRAPPVDDGPTMELRLLLPVAFRVGLNADE